MSAVRRRLVFALLTIAAAGVCAFAVLLGVDVYLHGRYERSAGFNVWGYRGRAVGNKARGEFRVVMLGGSSAYGYGVSADEAVPAVLERLLRERTHSSRFTVVNLGYNNEGAYAFAPTLQDYRWLHYDLALLYEGYNDLSSDRVNYQVFRRESPVFRLTGYMPIFPIVFREKAAAMVRKDARTQFHADLATRAGAGVLQATSAVADSLGEQLGRVSANPPRVENAAASGCSGRWAAYCQSVSAAVEFARHAGTQVIVATQPYLTVSAQVHDIHLSQQAELRAMLTHRFGGDANVGYVNLGDRIDLSDSAMSFDRMHLTVAGNKVLAAGLVEPVLAMASRAQMGS